MPPLSFRYAFDADADADASRCRLRARYYATHVAAALCRMRAALIDIDLALRLMRYCPHMRQLQRYMPFLCAHVRCFHAAIHCFFYRRRCHAS